MKKLERYEVRDFMYFQCSDGDVCMSEDVEKLEALNAELLEASEAIVARWDSPLWKWNGHTGILVERLRATIAKAKGEQP